MTTPIQVTLEGVDVGVTRVSHERLRRNSLLSHGLEGTTTNRAGVEGRIGLAESLAHQLLVLDVREGVRWEQTRIRAKILERVDMVGDDVVVFQREVRIDGVRLTLHHDLALIDGDLKEERRTIALDILEAEVENIPNSGGQIPLENQASLDSSIDRGSNSEGQIVDSNCSLVMRLRLLRHLTPLGHRLLPDWTVGEKNRNREVAVERQVAEDSMESARLAELGLMFPLTNFGSVFQEFDDDFDQRGSLPLRVELDGVIVRVEKVLQEIVAIGHRLRRSGVHLKDSRYGLQREEDVRACP